MVTLDISMKSLLEKLKKLLGLSKKTSGFTLIELLVVIGILGILAAALVATINPFEQLNKASDANVQNTLVEYIDANVRYYTTHSAMPWNDTANASVGNCTSIGSPAAPNATIVAENMSLMSDCTQGVISDGELKSSFTTVGNILDQIFITGGVTDLTACYAPKSQSQRNNPNTKFDSSGLTSSGCPNQTGNCYWCSE